MRVYTVCTIEITALSMVSNDFLLSSSAEIILTLTTPLDVSIISVKASTTFLISPTRPLAANVKTRLRDKWENLPSSISSPIYDEAKHEQKLRYDEISVISTYPLRLCILSDGRVLEERSEVGNSFHRLRHSLQLTFNLLQQVCLYKSKRVCGKNYHMYDIQFQSVTFDAAVNKAPAYRPT